jgi:hypothetical protein
MNNIDWVEIAMGLLATGVVALVGFVWRWSHKVTAMEKDVIAHKKRLDRMEADHDKVTDRMYSIAKDRASLMTRESHQNYSDSAQRDMARMIQMARYEADMKSKGEKDGRRDK